MQFSIVPSKRFNQRVVLLVDGKAISWFELEQLIMFAIATEEINNGKYPLRKRVKLISETLKISTKKGKKGFHHNVTVDLP